MTVRYGMVIDPRRCLKCDACVVACTAENALPPGGRRNWVTERETGIYPALAVTIEPGQCMQCDQAPCVRLCPTGASYVNDYGVVLVNADDCIGCRYCLAACPYEARYFDEESGTVDKCTFCEHRTAAGLLPACVQTCPARARTFGDLADPRSDVAVAAATRAAAPRKPDAGTGPKVLYLS